MTKASDNIFPKVTFVEGSAPSSPSASDFHLYFDSSDHLLKWKNSSGTVTTLATGTPVSYGQTNTYPTTFTGDTYGSGLNAAVTDVAAFSTRALTNSRIMQLTTLGASKDQRVRLTLGTTKAAAFDVTTCIAFQGYFWALGTGDVYFEVRGSTSADAQLFIWRIIPVLQNGVSSTPFARVDTIRPGGSSISSVDATEERKVPVGETITLRAVRDGSNVISFYTGTGTAPLALMPVGTGPSNTDAPYTQTVSGTLARIEYSIHTPSGPGSTAQWDAYVDYLASV